MTVTLDIERNGHVALLRFHNAPNNFATVEVLKKIADALEQLDQEETIRATVLTSEGKAFCAGADLVSENGFGAKGDDPLREFYDQAIRIFSVKKPIIAAVQGPAIGAGLGLAVAADFRVVSTAARFSANFVKLGFHPGFGLTCTLPRIVGEQRATQMFLTGNRYKPEELEYWGLIDRLASADQLLESALAFANEIAVNAPLSLLTTRATLRGNLVEQVIKTLKHEHGEQIKLQKTEDFSEGIRAVTERRPGNFVGR